MPPASARGVKRRMPVSRAVNDYHPQLTVSHRALLVRGSDVEFRRLIYRLILVEERLRHVRAYFGRQIGLTGPQYLLLISVAYLQGATGIAIHSLARNLRVTSAFITSETRPLIKRGLLTKRTNPHDSRSRLLSVTAAGRRRIEEMVPEVRAVNDRFFRYLTQPSFRRAKRILEQLLDGSREAMEYIATREGHGAKRTAVPRRKNVGT